MSRTPNSTSTPRPANNYAQVAAAQPTSKTVQQQQQPIPQRQQQQIQPNQQTPIAVVSANTSSSRNGKPTQKAQPQQNSSISNGSSGRVPGPSIKQSSIPKNANGVSFQNISSNALPINNPTPITFGSLDQTSGDVSLSSSPVQNSTVTGGKVPPQISKTSTPVFGTLTARGTSEELAHPIPIQQTPTTLPAPGPNAFSGPGRPANARTITLDFPRTHSAPPQLNLQDSTKSTNQSVGHQSTAATSNRPAIVAGTNNQQQSTTNTPPIQTPATPRQQQQHTIHTAHEPPHHRKDSVSSTVSSNDGQQQNQSYHPHPHPHGHPHPHPHPHPQTHHQNHNNHNHYSGSHHPRQQHHQKPGGGPGPAGGQGIQYNRPPRDKNMHIPPSPHLNPAQPPVPSTIQMAPQAPMMTWPPYTHTRPNPEWYMSPYYDPHQYSYIYQMPPAYVNVAQRVQVTPPPPPPFSAPSKASKAIPIINPETKQEFVSKSPSVKKDEPSSPVATNLDAKKLNELEKEKAKQEISSKAVKIVDPTKEDRSRKEKDEKEKKEREERERKEREEQERKEREEQERMERERIEREEQEMKERERLEREERERIEREERERQEREEQERRERERLEREEQERKEREERERLEREEQERKEREERERRAREEQERKEREERERRVREEQERKEREERERKEREEKERKEKEERERREREEQERIERERLAREEQEKKEREEKEREEQERKEREREEQEKKEKEEKERLELQRKKEEAKAAEEAEKKRESELATKKEEKKHGKGHRPGPLDLSNANNPDVPGAPLSALSSARNIEDINSVQYPSGYMSPNPALNANAEPGKFKYDRGFLMQFMDICTEKPENLPALDAIGMDEPKEDKKNRGPNRSSSGSASGRAQHKGSPNQSSYTNMNEFKPPKDSNERFMQSTMRMNMGTGGNFNRSSMPPRASSGNPILPPSSSMSGGNQPSSPGRASSQRQTNRDRDRQDKRRNVQHSQPGAPTIPPDQVVPLEHSENRWVPASVLSGPSKQPSEDIPSTETVQRKIKALLNKLTLERFESISDQIIDYANKSRDEKDGRILKQVIQLTFIKACDESNFSQMYAQLCRKMMERVDPQILDEGVKNAQGYVQGGTLFRKYLLNRCQEDFEKGWKSSVPVPSNEKGEPDLLSDEYYVVAKAKRIGLGLIKFIGELFKLNMLTERIMHECVKKLLSNVSSPEEEETESLCKLLTTVGKQLDHPKAKEHMDAYFARMNKMAENTKLSSRIKFMLLDVIDLRENNWVPRRDNNAPKTIAEIHEDAAKQKEEAELLRRTTSSGGRGLPRMADQLSRGGSGRRDKGNPHGANAPLSNADGWSTVGSSSSANRKQDLSRFGSLPRTKVSNLSLAPGGGAFSVLRASKPDSRDRDERPTPGRTNTTPATTNANPFSVLTHAESEGRKSFDGPSTESSKTTGSNTATERPKLNLLPRTIGSNTQAKGLDTVSKPGSPPPTKTSSLPATIMNKEQAEKKIKSMIEEYWAVLDTKEFNTCIKELPPQYQSEAINRMFLAAIEKKQRDVDNATKLFSDLSNSESAITKSDFVKAFTEALPIIEDLSPDIPLVYSFTGQFMYSSKLDLKDITELALKLDDSGSEPAPAKVVVAYLKALNESENALNRKVKESNFDIKTVFPKGATISEINKFLDKYGLPELKR